MTGIVMPSSEVSGTVGRSSAGVFIVVLRRVVCGRLVVGRDVMALVRRYSRVDVVHSVGQVSYKEAKGTAQKGLS
jgi:hypothetical protein